MYNMVKTVTSLTAMLDDLNMRDRKEPPVNKPSKSDPTKSLMSKFKKLNVTADRKIQKQTQKRRSRTIKKNPPRTSLRTTRQTENLLVNSLSNMAFGSKEKKGEGKPSGS